MKKCEKCGELNLATDKCAHCGENMAAAMTISGRVIIDRLQNPILCIGPKCENKEIMGLAIDHITDLERQLQEAQRWKLAVDNELVCCHLGTTDSMEPSVAIAAIGRWHYDLGVSGVCEPDSTAGEPE